MNTLGSTFGSTLLSTLLIGVGATATMDIWGYIRKTILKSKAPDYAMVGRWLGHFGNRQVKHLAIAKSPPIRGERIIGWSAHYLIGIVFASLLILVWDEGVRWIQSPTLVPALAWGMITVAAPYFLMQPGMGAGIAASRTPAPWAARWQSLLNHVVFGLGLYISAILCSQLMPA